MRGFSCWFHPRLRPGGSDEGMSPLRTTLLIALAFLVGVGATVAALDLLAPPPSPRVEPIRLSPDEQEPKKPPRKKSKRPRRPKTTQPTAPAPAPAAPAPAPVEDDDDGAPLAPAP